MQKLHTPNQPQQPTDSFALSLQNIWELHAFMNSYPIIDTLQYLKMNEPTQSCPNDVSAHLRILGLSLKHSGYRCLLDIIPKFKADPGLMMKEILPEVAERFGLPNALCAEHAIRTAIHKAWESRTLSIWVRYFPLNKDGDISRPTSKEFIFSIIEKL